jgi:predicted GNAT family acetyltransferase
MIREVKPREAEAVERFLSSLPDSSLILRSNLRSAGVTFSGKPYEATWVAQFEGERVTAVVAHAWNGNLILQAPSNAAELCRRALELSQRELEGFIGPWEQLEAARSAFGLGEAAFSLLAREVLMNVRVETISDVNGVRLARLEELEALTRWSADFDREALLEEPNVDEVRANLQRGIAAARWYVLEEEGALKAMGAFTARTADSVQLGGVYTPPSGRNRGAARRLVAGMLKQSGVERGVLFAKDPAAIRSYLAVGFRECGTYGLAFLK